MAGGPRPQARPVTQPGVRTRPAAAGQSGRVAPAGPARPVTQQPMAQRTAARPVSAQPRPAAQQPQAAYRQPMARPVAEAGQMQPAQGRSAQPQAAPTDAAPAKRGGWRVVVQFVVGLLVIVGVAAAIVALYVRYYQ